jgi:hypothetical protein
MKVKLEVTGGFTGKAGAQTIEEDTDRLDPATATQIGHALKLLPDQTWGQSYLSPHPKSWDFLHKLTITDAHGEKTVQFHSGVGPPGLTRIAELLTSDPSDENAEL